MRKLAADDQNQISTVVEPLDLDDQKSQIAILAQDLGYLADKTLEVLDESMVAETGAAAALSVIQYVNQRVDQSAHEARRRLIASGISVARHLKAHPLELQNFCDDPFWETGIARRPTESGKNLLRYVFIRIHGKSSSQRSEASRWAKQASEAYDSKIAVKDIPAFLRQRLKVRETSSKAQKIKAKISASKVAKQKKRVDLGVLDRGTSGFWKANKGQLDISVDLAKDALVFVYVIEGRTNADIERFISKGVVHIPSR